MKERTFLAIDTVGLLLGALLALLGGLIAQLYQSHREELAAKRASYMKIVRWCEMCFNYTKNWVNDLSIGATSRIVNSNLRAVILQTTGDIYQRSLEDFGSAIDSIGAPLQKGVQNYCDLLYTIWRHDYDSDASGGLTSQGSAELLTDLKKLLKICDDVKINLLTERSTLVDCRILRSFLRRLRKYLDS